jgi:hypothetical protein
MHMFPGILLVVSISGMGRKSQVSIIRVFSGFLGRIVAFAVAYSAIQNAKLNGDNCAR